jgi:hypothetical protein
MGSRKTFGRAFKIEAVKPARDLDIRGNVLRKRMRPRAAGVGGARTVLFIGVRFL